MAQPFDMVVKSLLSWYLMLNYLKRLNWLIKFDRLYQKKSIKNKNTGQDFGKITMSFGIAEFSNNEIQESIIQRADAALYLAKENGRNRVQLETDLKKEDIKQAS